MRLDDTYGTTGTWGAVKSPGGVIKKRPAVSCRQVRAMVQAAVKDGAEDTACLMAVARMFLLRVPSEGIPLQWDGTHSTVELEEKRVTLTLMSTKGKNVPTVMVRDCCCETAGKSLCAVHWLRRQKERVGGAGRVFRLTRHQFTKDVKVYGEKAGVQGWQSLGTHAFRRGMAQAILDEGGSLALLLKAGGWTSSAFLHYLRESQVQDVAVGQTIINLSDSEEE